MNDQRPVKMPEPGGYVAVPQEALNYLYPQMEQPADEPEFNLREIWSAIYRNIWFIVAIVAVCVAAAVAYSLMTAPVYRATAKVQIDQQTAKVLESQDEEPVPSSQEADRFLQTQVDVIRSRSLARRVEADLKLASDARFLAAEPKSVEGGASAKVKGELAVDVLKDRLSVNLPRNSRVVDINFESTDPNLAAKIANSFAENAITSNLQRRFDTSAYSRKFLQERLVTAKQSLEDSERKVVTYARSAGLIDASAGMTNSASLPTNLPAQSLTTSSLVQINQALSQAQANRIQAQQRWASASSTPALNLPEVLGNPTVQQLTQKRAELEASYNEERQRRKEGHPMIVQAGAKLAELDRQINSVASSIKKSIREQYVVAAKQEQGLQGSVGALKGATFSEQDRSVQYNILKRQSDTDRQMYDGLLQRYRELSAAAGITSNNISIVDRAEVPSIPVWPRPLLNVALGGMAGLCLSLVFVFLRERFDDAIRSSEDVERKLSLPLLGTVPLLKKGLTPQDALDDPRSTLSEAHYALRHSLELSSDRGLPFSILLTSSRQSEGKSTSAYAISRDLAAAGKRVLLIDADLRKPSLHRVMAQENRVGLANLLARQKGLNDVVQTTQFENLFFVSSGPLPPNPAQLLAGPGMVDLIAKLRPIFDVVIIDGPPVLGLADAPRLADVVDGTLFVVEANGAHYGHAKAALKRLVQSNVNLLGVILTKFDARKAGYKSDYGYYYYEYGTKEPKQISEA
jgi:capsular exopolysaccharide synthesis family protein